MITIKHVPTRYRPTLRIVIVRHERQAMIPDHMRYRPPEWWRERYREYGLHFGRWRLDTRFLVLPEPEQLPAWELRAIDTAIAQRARERPHSMSHYDE